MEESLYTPSGSPLVTLRATWPFASAAELTPLKNANLVGSETPVDVMEDNLSITK